MEKTSKIFMAFAKGTESTDGVSVVRYTGVGSCNVVGINPTKEQLEKLYGNTLDNEPEYFGTMQSDGKDVPYARVTFLVKPDPEKYGMDINPISISLFVRKEFKFSNDGTKVKVIDEYGNTGWATKEQCQAHAQLMSKAGKPLKISTNYRPAYIGEVELTDFLKQYLVIPEAFEYVNENWQLKKDADMGIARFEDIEKLFKGNFSEVEEAIAYRPDNQVKILFGVKTNDEGKMYQAFYKEMFLKNSVTNYSKLDKDVQDRKNNGAYATTDFDICDFKVYSVAPTSLAEAPAADPFAAATPNNPWFPNA